MELGSQTSIGGHDGRSTVELLDSIRKAEATREAALVDEWVAIVAWADRHALDGTLDPKPLAGPGTPGVDEFDLMELITVLGRSPIGGKLYVAQIVECAWRLPNLYAAVVAGRVSAWRAGRIADLTLRLSPQAAAFVDRQLFDANGIGWAQLERLVQEATIRFDPDTAEADRAAAQERRKVEIRSENPDAVNGVVYVDAVLDAADGQDLNEAIARRAALRGKLGDTDSIDVRRAKAVGELARNDLALDLLVANEETGEVLAQVPGRRVTLNVHVTDTTLTGDNPVARFQRQPVSSEQVRERCRTAATVIVRPILDLADNTPVDSYEIPDRLRRQVIERDHTCRFPWCGRPAESCDLDHVHPFARGGPTAATNLAAACRTHHRAKTHSGWTYRMLHPGWYLWTSPHRHQFLVGPHGTTTLTKPDGPDGPAP